MSTSHATCPLCGSLAEVTAGPHDDYRHYECPTCVEFLITPVAEKIVQSGADHVRAAFSRQAQKSDAVRLWSIRRASKAEIAAEPSASLSASFVPRGT